MSTVRTWRTTSTSSEDTLELAETIGRKLRGGEVIELVSDLGGGKTTFVRGLARGMGCKETVRSPSFTLSTQYRAGGLTLYHFDFYRLNEPGIMRDELAEVLTDPQAVVAIEWADVVKDVAPDTHVTVQLKIRGDSRRELSFIYPAELEYAVGKPAEK